MDSSNNWQRLSYANSSTLRGTIEELHHASQYLARIGHSFLPSSEGNPQWGMRWSLPLEGLLSRSVMLNMRVRLALIYPSFEFRFIDDQEHALSSLKLHGQSQRKVKEWIQESLAYLGNRGQSLRAIADYALPHHYLDSGGPFRNPGSGSLEELAKYRHNAVCILKEFSERFVGAGSIRTWPQHFDTKVDIPLESELMEPEGKALSLGFGVSEGKQKDCYFFVRPQKTIPLRIKEYEGTPDLPHGKWITTGQIEAILTVDELLEAETAAGQHEMAFQFFRSAINESLRNLKEGSKAIR